MFRWIASHFHDWISVDYHGVAFSIELLEWGRAFSDFWVRQFFIFNNYSPKAKWILSNNPQDEVEGIIRQ